MGSVLTKEFDYKLPKALIASKPLANRSESKLLHLNGDGTLAHLKFTDILNLLKPNDLLVLNNTKVIPARLKAFKATGGKLEILIERLIAKDKVSAHVRNSKSLKPGDLVYLDATSSLRVESKDAAGLVTLVSEGFSIAHLLSTYGEMPIPPYLERAAIPQDIERYQTVYAREEGAVAAPTAGLHFDEPLLKALHDKGVQIASLTLHIGAGTFQPVKADKIADHVMHYEWMTVNAELCAAVAKARALGGRVIAVGTSALRSLEAAASTGLLQEMTGQTNLFIKPGYQFKVVDALITNFHLPASTLLMLVSALAGVKEIQAAYQIAIEHQYRFYSYGDAMFIEQAKQKFIQPKED